MKDKYTSKLNNWTTTTKNDKSSNVGNMLQRLGKIGINKKIKSVNDENQPCLDPEITSLQILYTI